jgi:hypothetical protein
VIVTRVPTGIRCARRRMAAFGMRTQPCETWPGSTSGWFVPWMPMKPPFSQSATSAPHPHAVAK